MAPQMGLSAEHSPALRQVRMNIGGANVANTLRQSSTNMGKLGPNQQKWMQEMLKRKTQYFVVDETPFKWQL